MYFGLLLLLFGIKKAVMTLTGHDDNSNGDNTAKTVSEYYYL